MQLLVAALHMFLLIAGELYSISGTVSHKLTSMLQSLNIYTINRFL